MKQRIPTEVAHIFPTLEVASATDFWWTDTKLVLQTFDELANATLRHFSSSSEWRQFRTLTRSGTMEGNAFIHRSATLLPGVALIGDVIICSGSEIGPNCTIFGPTFIGPNSYVGPGAEIRRTVAFSELTMSHFSYLGHSVVGHRVNLAAGFITAVRNLKRNTVHVFDGGVLRDTGHNHFGAIIADGYFCRVGTHAMPGRLLSVPNW